MLVKSQHQSSCTLLKLRARHIAIHLILIGVRHLVAEARIPYEALLIAGEVQRIVEKAVVRLIFRAHICLHLALGQGGRSVQNQHTSHCITSVHQAGRTLQNLYGVHNLRIDLYAMFVAPLLSLLANAFVHHDDAIVT